MKKIFRNFLIAWVSIFGLVTLVGTLLFALNVVALAANVFTFIFFGVEIVLISILCYSIYLIIKAIKKRKQQKIEEQVRKDREQQLLALYQSFGIPPQRKPDGSLKNFYELLGIEPQYDEFGERVPTVYELLHIVPKFDEQGKEIPAVVFIKNKAVKASLKVPATMYHLNRKMTKEEKEYIKKEQQLASEVKIAKLSGDKKQEKSATKKLKGMPKRKQKYVAMVTGKSAGKSTVTLDAFGGLIFSFEPPKLDDIDKFIPKSSEKPAAPEAKRPEVEVRASGVEVTHPPVAAEAEMVKPPKSTAAPKAEEKPAATPIPDAVNKDAKEEAAFMQSSNADNPVEKIPVKSGNETINSTPVKGTINSTDQIFNESEAGRG